MIHPITLEGKTFELTLREQACGHWHWLITAPGQLVLSGEAASETQARESACSTGQALVRLAAA
jgi:hypothetical protein